MNMIRTFVAVEVSAEVLRRVETLVERLRVSRADVKWVAVQKMHLTLKFLGDVAADAIPALGQALAQAAARFSPLSISVHGTGVFPDARRPRTVWLGLKRGAQELVALQAVIEHALVPLGHRREERGFHPHLTLGRVRSGGPALRDLTNLIREQAEFDAGETEVREVVLLASHLDRSGPTYEVLGRMRLGTAATETASR